MWVLATSLTRAASYSEVSISRSIDALADTPEVTSNGPRAGVPVQSETRLTARSARVAPRRAEATIGSYIHPSVSCEVA